MNLPKYWPVAVLFVAVLVYFWIDEDEPLPSKQAQQENTAGKHLMTGSAPATRPSPLSGGQSGNHAPAYTPGAYQSGYTQSGQADSFQEPYRDKYRFRNDDPIDNTSNRFQDPYGRPQQNRDNYYSMPPEFQDYAGPGNFPVPDENSSYRFRPQDKKKQSKRWDGNYSRKPIPRYQQQGTYPYENRPPPVNHVRPTTQQNPLWANSWPER